MSDFGFRGCSVHSPFGGLVSEPLRKRFVPEPNSGRCSFCKHEFDMTIAEMKIGDVCKGCKKGKGFFATKIRQRV